MQRINQCRPSGCIYRSPLKRFQTAYLVRQGRLKNQPTPEYIMKKTIILAVPYMYGLDQCIEKNLRFLGFDVINLCYDDRDSYYPNLNLN